MERFYRYLKGGLKVWLVGNYWVDDFFIVFFGIWVSFKEGLFCILVELVYGMIFCLLGDFFVLFIVEDVFLFVL